MNKSQESVDNEVYKTNPVLQVFKQKFPKEKATNEYAGTLELLIEREIHLQVLDT